MTRWQHATVIYHFTQYASDRYITVRQGSVVTETIRGGDSNAEKVAEVLEALGDQG